MNATNEELQNVRSFHAFTAWVFAAGIGVLSSAVVFMAVSGAGF